VTGAGDGLSLHPCAGAVPAIAGTGPATTRTPAQDTLATSPLVSILIPTLDEERELPHVLDHVGALHGRWETIVADGGSRDATLAVARAHHVRPRVIESAGGRAAQLNAAAHAATGELLLFLHADSRLPRDAYAALAEAWRSAPPIAGGNFALRFAGDGVFERALGAVYGLQRRHGFYYGDSSVWARRDAFAALDGFREIPIMDDYDFVRRLERSGTTRCLPGPASTSARRWRGAGITRTVLAWFVIRWLFVAGVAPQRLVRLYRAVR
jgi:rSAM/selenodomain-associated transferase 2